MYDSNFLTKSEIKKRPLSALNWEEDIKAISIHKCRIEDDPMGFRVTFVRSGEENRRNRENQYSIGASYLKNRLKKLNKAGFNAPMTQKAINIIDQERLKSVAV